MEISVRRVFIVVVISSVLTPFVLLRISMSHRLGNSRTYLPSMEIILHSLTKHKEVNTSTTIHSVYNLTNVVNQKEKGDDDSLTSYQSTVLPKSNFSIFNDTVPMEQNQTANFINPYGSDQQSHLEVHNDTVKSRYSPQHKFPNESTNLNVNIVPSTNSSMNCSSRYVLSTPPKHLFPDQRVLFMDGVGRLGNKMFQYASLLGIAKKNGFKPLVHSKSLIVPIFEINHVTHIKYSDLPVCFEVAAAKYDPCLETLRKDTDWRLGGYYQSWRYFQPVEQDIRKEFTFKKDLQERVNKTLADLPSEFKGRPKVGVHVRRGDMSVTSSIKKGYTVASREYFVKAMEYFRTRLKNPVFLVLSDDMNWVRRNLGAEKDVVLKHANNEMDLATLASCDHSIVSTGTFGWWGAWLAGGLTVYYKSFPKNGTWLDTQYNHQDYFPPSWIGME